ncbi:MAG: hypothetical protein AB1486_34480, partial [Planctomycetota bacterium]
PWSVPGHEVSREEEERIAWLNALDERLRRQDLGLPSRPLAAAIIGAIPLLVLVALWLSRRAQGLSRQRSSVL